MKKGAIIIDETKELLDKDNYLSFDEITSKGVITKSNCITGNTDHFVDYLREAFKKAKSIHIIVAFLMESGVQILSEDLKLIKEKNIPIRILNGNYLNITQLQALYLLKDIFGESVDLRFYKERKRYFHPKAYIVDYEKSEEKDCSVIDFIRPKGSQIEALYELKKARAEGLDEAVILRLS